MLRSTKRRFPRAPIRVAAMCTVNHTRVDGIVWQIGEGGLFVELPTVDGLPEQLAVAFELPGYGPHRVVAKPVWSSTSPTKSAPRARRGAGCEFCEVSPKTKEAVIAYVSKMKQTYSSLQFALALDRPTPQLPALLRETELDRVRDRRELKELVAAVVAQLRTMS